MVQEETVPSVVSTMANVLDSTLARTSVVESTTMLVLSSALLPLIMVLMTAVPATSSNLLKDVDTSTMADALVSSSSTATNMLPRNRAVTRILWMSQMGSFSLE